MKKNMKILVGLFSIMLCLFISGCGNRGTDTKEASGFTDFENIEKEYLETLQELNWPENMELPTALEGETADQFQIGLQGHLCCGNMRGKKNGWKLIPVILSGQRGHCKNLKKLQKCYI